MISYIFSFVNELYREGNVEQLLGGVLKPLQPKFVYIQDGASGLVQVAVGPYKESIGEIDKIVLFDEKTRWILGFLT